MREYTGGLCTMLVPFDYVGTKNSTLFTPLYCYITCKLIIWVSLVSPNVDSTFSYKTKMTLGTKTLSSSKG